MPNDLEQRPYKLYRAAPRGLKARLRGEEELAFGPPDRPSFDGNGGGPQRPRRFGGFTWKKGLLYLVGAVLAWLLVSLVLFLVSAQIERGKVPASAKRALSSGGNMLTSTDTILVIGTDQRPKGSKEPGANRNDAGSRSDTLMLWRVGGGTSRRLSIPRDTAVPIPGHGTGKINAAYALGGIDIKTPRICSEISGGVRNGGFTLNLKPGTHHLNGTQALTLARTRENRCNPSENDLTREKRQQQILNSIKSRLTSPSTFFRLPWVSWTAPQAVRTDMGGLTMLSLFAAAEIGGSAPTEVLKPTGTEALAGGDALTVSQPALNRAVDRLMGR